LEWGKRWANGRGPARKERKGGSNRHPGRRRGVGRRFLDEGKQRKEGYFS